MTAVIKYIYGADDDEVLSLISVSKAMQALWQELKSTVNDYDIDEEASHFGDNATGNTVCVYDSDPEPWQSRIAAQAALQIIHFYILTDKYQLNPLSHMLFHRPKSLTSTAWNHSDVLDVIDAVFSSISDQDKLYIWLFKEIELRLPILLTEHLFMECIKTNSELHHKIRTMMMAMVGREYSWEQRPFMKYCCYSHDDSRTHCRRNVIWAEVGRSGRRVCHNCWKDQHGFPERKHLWAEEDDQAGPMEG